ncbi:hypothetical protein H3T50_07475 [Commensalibacter sp. M0134]|nr:hypothetical protein [Commensalibacter sp. M0134]MBI0070458.1 hypothetical protein [Commensalibacter sp. M0133]MBI0081826.1 hypothetical protein [Commensalibacter melissae]
MTRKSYDNEKKFVKIFVSKVIDEMKETDKQIIKHQQEVEKRLIEKKEIIEQVVRLRKK